MMEGISLKHDHKILIKQKMKTNKGKCRIIFLYKTEKICNQKSEEDLHNL